MNKKETLVQRMLILNRQCGNVSGSISFYTRTPEDEVEKRRALMLHLQGDLGDLLLQTKMLIKDLELNEDEILLHAFERYDECKEEFRQKGKSQYFV